MLMTFYMVRLAASCTVRLVWGCRCLPPVAPVAFSAGHTARGHTAALTQPRPQAHWQSHGGLLSRARVASHRRRAHAAAAMGRTNACVPHRTLGSPPTLAAVLLVLQTGGRMASGAL